MKGSSSVALWGATLLLSTLLPNMANAQTPDPSSAAREARIAWFRDARFGMFIHWGVYSGLGNEFQGKKGGGYAEHIQRVLKIPMATYRTEVVEKFNPTKFNAEEWVQLAKRTGMKYVVVTAKHHDGFAMWPSKVSKYNISDATPFKRDPIQELKEACDRNGLKFGFYYSHAFDWGEENGPGNDWDYKNPGGDLGIGGHNWWETTPDFMPKAKKYVDEKAIPQLLELIDNYHPDILWFDTPHKLPDAENKRILDAVRKAAPNTVINGRLVYGQGDYDNTADTPIVLYPKSGDWEAIPTTNQSYGWNPLDKSYRPASFFIELLAEAAARCGNLLMNVGPMGDGEIDPVDVKIFNGIGDWWQVNGESIRGTTATPLPVQGWGQSTRKGNKLYLQIYNWPQNGQLVVGGLESGVKSAQLLIGPGKRKSLKISRPNGLDIVLNDLPKTAPNEFDSVIVLDCTAGIVTDTRRLLQPQLGEEMLHTFDATLQNDSAQAAAANLATGVDQEGRLVGVPQGRIRYGSGTKLDDFIQGFRNNRQAVVWPVRVPTPITYDVTLEYAANKESEGGEFAVQFGSQVLKGTVQESPGNRWHPRGNIVPLGRISLQPGALDISILALKINGQELFNPRKLTLTPFANTK